MSWYKWIGQTTHKKHVQGIMLASSQNDIQHKLTERHIKLIYACTCATPQRPFSREVKSALCHTLSNLLEAGIQLQEALELTAQTINHPFCKAILEEASTQLKAGREFSTTLQAHRHLFDEVMLTLIAAGEVSAALVPALNALTHFYTMQENFIKKTKAALFLPCITFSLFIMITVLLFLFFIPRFETLFLSTEKPIPWYTQTLFTISHFIQSWYGICSAVAIGVIVTLLYTFRSHPVCRHYLERILLHIPVARSFIWYSQLSFFFQTLGILLSNNIHLVPSMHVAIKAIRIKAIQSEMNPILHDIESGQDLPSAWQARLSFLSPALHALITLGQKTGNMGSMIIKAALWTTQEVHHTLSLLQTYIPVFALCLLALLIGSLIIIVYIPLLSLSHTLM